MASREVDPKQIAENTQHCSLESSYRVYQSWPREVLLPRGVLKPEVSYKLHPLHFTNALTRPTENEASKQASAILGTRYLMYLTEICDHLYFGV